MTAGGEQIGPYEIRGRLGQGAMAVVWLGYDPSLDREVAIKEPLAPPFGDADARQRFSERFVREARAAASLNHPGIVTIHSTATYDGRPVIVMELVDGPTLRQVLDTRRLTAEESFAVAEGLLEAVAYAHARGVVHRDIKPDNVFITPDGVVKLADFGVARMDEDVTLTRDGAIIGTPAYMSPEQVLGREVGSACDVFALGSIVWELLCGSPPFSGPAGTHVVAVLHRIVNGELPAEPSCELAAEVMLAVARRALSVPVEERFADAGEMLAAWRDTSPGKVEGRALLAGLAALVPERPAAASVGFGSWPGGSADATTAPLERSTAVALPSDITVVDAPSPLEASRRKVPPALVVLIAVVVLVGTAAGAVGVSRWIQRRGAESAAAETPTTTPDPVKPRLLAKASRTKATKGQKFSVSVSVEGTSLPDGTVVLLERSSNGTDWADARILRLSGDAATATVTITATTHFRFATLGDSQTAPILSEPTRVTFVKPRVTTPPRGGGGSSGSGTSPDTTATPEEPGDGDGTGDGAGAGNGGGDAGTGDGSGGNGGSSEPSGAP